MPESRPPRLSTAWSVVWLVLVGTVVLWLFIQLLSMIWGWLLLIAGIAIVVTVVVIWLRRRSRW